MRQAPRPAQSSAGAMTHSWCSLHPSVSCARGQVTSSSNVVMYAWPDVEVYAEKLRKALCETFVQLDNEWSAMGHLSGRTRSNWGQWESLLGSCDLSRVQQILTLATTSLFLKVSRCCILFASEDKASTFLAFLLDFCLSLEQLVLGLSHLRVQPENGSTCLQSLVFNRHSTCLKKWQSWLTYSTGYNWMLNTSSCTFCAKALTRRPVLKCGCNAGS